MDIVRSDCKPATRESLAEADSQISVCALSLSDLKGWENKLKDPANDPFRFIRHEVQVRNDCRAHSLTNAVERLSGREGFQLSRTSAYLSMNLMEGSIGADDGAMISTGITLLKKGFNKSGVSGIGIPDENLWPYAQYVPRIRDFAARWQQKTIIDSAKTNAEIVGSVERAPEFEKALAIVACGGAIDWGTYWPIKMNADRVVLPGARTGGMGHATTALWAVQRSGKWFLKFANSHPQFPFYFVGEAEYELLRNIERQPFGAYGLLPSKPIERFYEGQFSLMG